MQFSRRSNWTRTVNRLTRLARGRKDLIDLTVSNPTQCGFAYERERLLAALGKAASLKYEPHPLGIESARAAVCRYYADREVKVEPERIVLTASTSEGYSYLMRLLCNPGESLATPRPSYPLLEMLAEVNDVRLNEGRVRGRVLIHPNNPTGEYIGAERWAALQGGAVPLIVDEVFYDYPVGEFQPPRHDYAAARVPTFVLNGLSKTAALPQMKLGWIAVFGPLADDALRRLEMIADTYLSVGTPVQLAAAEMLSSRGEMQRQIRARVNENLAELDRALARRPEMARMKVEGGWSAVLRLPNVRKGDDWAEYLVEAAGVLTHPGHFYGYETPGILVISLLPEPVTFAEGVRRLISIETCM